MVARPFQCDRTRLRLLLDDRLEDDEQAELARHLESCASCRRSLEQLAAESRWWGDARLLADEVPPTTGPEGADATRDALGFLDPPEKPGQVGRLGPYEVLEVIGRGGMGLVLKALDPSLNRFVAIKMLAPELATSATARRRFAREARAVAAIAHDHIVAIHAVDAAPGGLPYIVMQYVAGRSLQDRLDRTGPLAVHEILRIGMQAASGLAAAHALGLVHRDIKPANILLENCVERVKLTDFGLARAADDASLTQSGVVAGTPQYMAPEQARGEAVDTRSDLFSLGSVLYTLCTGRPPFRAETTMGVLRRVCEDRPRPIREVNPEIPDWLVGIVEKLQAKKPADRFATAAEVAELLGRCLAYLEQPSAAPPPFAAELPPPAPRRKARGWAAGLAALALLIVGLGASEASGVSHLADFVATVLRIKTPDGTLVIKVEDPDVKLRVDDEDVVITGAGPEVRLPLRAGAHWVEKSKGGVARRDLIVISRGGKETVTAALESEPAPADPAAEQLAQQWEDVRTRRATAEKILEHLRAERATAVTITETEIRKAFNKLPEVAPVNEQLETARAKLESARQLDRSGGGDPAVKHHQERVNQLEAKLSDLWKRNHGWIREMLARDVGSDVDKAIRQAEADLLVLRAQEDALRERMEMIQKAASQDRPHVGPAQSLLESLRRDLEANENLRAEKTERLLRETQAQLDRQRRDQFNAAEIKRLQERIKELEAQLPTFQPLDPRVKALNEARKKLEEIRVRARNTNDPAVRHQEEVVKRLEDELRRQPMTGSPSAPVRVFLIAPATPVGPPSAPPPQAAPRGMMGLPGAPVVGSAPPPALPPIGPAHPGTTRSAVFSVAVAPDGKTLAYGCQDGTIFLIDLATGRTRNILTGHSSEVYALAFAPDGKTLASADGGWHDRAQPGVVKLWDAASGRLLRELHGHTRQVWSVAFSPDGKTLASGSWDRTARLWDVATGKVRAVLKGHKGAVRCLAFPPQDSGTRPDGFSTLVTAGFDGEVWLWKCNAGRPDGDVLGSKIHKFGFGLNGLAFSPDGKTLAMCPRPADDKEDRADEVVILDLTTWKVRHRLKGHRHGVLAVTFSPDGKTLATGGGFYRPDDGDGGGEVFLWDAATGRESARFTHLQYRVESLAFTPDGKTLISGGGTFDEGGEVRIWNARQPARLSPRLKTSPLLGDRIWCLAYSPDGRTLAIGAAVRDQDAPNSRVRGALSFWDGRGDRPGEPVLAPRHIRALAYSPDGALMATAEVDGQARLREAATGREMKLLKGHADGVNGVAFTPDGKLLATAGLDGTVMLWDAHARPEVLHPLRTLSGHEAPVYAVAVSPDGKTLASCGADETARLWELATGRPKAVLEGHEDVVEFVTFAPDGKTVATTSWDRTVKLWDAETGRLLGTLTGHDEPVLSAAFSPDGKTLATCGGTWGQEATNGPGRGELKLWDVASKTETATLTGHTDRVFGVAFSPDGKTLASAGGDGVVMLWDLNADRPAQTAVLRR